MSECDQTFDPIILIGHCDRISRFFQSMFAYDKTFDPEVFLGHCDLISRFSDFALYLDTQLVHFHTVFRLCLSMTRPLTPIYL